jgi:phosphatidylglycerophosphatase A
MDKFESENSPAMPSIRSGGWVVWLATGSYFGLSPIMPGTVGALWGLPLSWALEQVPWPILRGICIVALCLAGIPLCSEAVRRMGGKKDPGSIVWDEIASLPITFFLVPMNSAVIVVAGFVLHRVFDITKPPPARQLERLPEGLGVMADDWIAGIYSNLSLHLLLGLGWLQG